MKIEISKIKETLVEIILSKSKLTEEEAEILAGDYLEGELQGKQSHGIAAFPAVVEKLAEAQIVLVEELIKLNINELKNKTKLSENELMALKKDAQELIK